MKRIIFLLAAVFGCLQSSYGVVSDLPDREGPVDFATDITDRADVQPTPRVVTCSTQKVLLDEAFSITVHDAWPGVTYSLYKSGEMIQSAEGTGRDLVFTGAFGPGEFSVRDSQGQEMKNKVTSPHYWPLTYDFDRPSLAYSPPQFRDKNGGVHQFTLAAMPYLDPAEMDMLFARYNAGDYPKWDNQVMRIEVAEKEKYFSGEYFVYWIYHINVYCAPNITSGRILNEAGFTVYNSSSYGTFGIYDTGGQLTDWNVRVVRDTALGVGLCLTNTQPLVTYELYNNGIFATSKQQDSMRDLYFYDLDPGVYTVKAVYKTVSMEHQGEYEIQYDVDIKKKPCILVDEATPIVLGADGGTRILSCTRKPFVEIAKIEQNISEFNAQSGNVKMRLLDSSTDHCNIELTWMPNYSVNELTVDSRFIFNGTTLVRFIVPSKSTVTIYDMEYGLQPNPYIKVLGSQSGFTYETRRQFYGNGPKITGTGSSILFENLPEGIYTVWATDPATGCTRKMNGTAILDPNPDVFKQGKSDIYEDLL